MSCRTPDGIQPMQMKKLFAAFSCWFMAAGALMAWWWPQYLDAGSWTRYLGAIVLIEFLTMHSIGMLSGILITPQNERQKPITRRKKSILQMSAVVLAGFYLLLAYGVSTEIKSTSLFVEFLGLMLSRLIEFFGTTQRHELMRDLYRSFFGLGMIVTFVFVAAFIPFPAGAVSGRSVDCRQKAYLH